MKKIWKIIIIVVVSLLVLMVALKCLSNEDDWICKDGEWIKHGFPAAEKPVGSCEANIFQRVLGS